MKRYYISILFISFFTFNSCSQSRLMGLQVARLLMFNDSINDIAVTKINNEDCFPIYLRSDKPPYYNYMGFDFPDNVKDGKWLVLSSDSIILFEINFISGKTNGIVRKYFESGDLYSLTEFKNGKVNGLQITFNEQGIPINISYRVENKIQGREYVFRKDKIIIEDHKDGLYDGEIIKIPLLPASKSPYKNKIDY